MTISRLELVALQAKVNQLFSLTVLPKNPADTHTQAVKGGGDSTRRRGPQRKDSLKLQQTTKTPKCEEDIHSRWQDTVKYNCYHLLIRNS